MREVKKLQELAAWYREFAERAGNPAIWEARLHMAEDLEQEADRMLRQRAERKNRREPARAQLLTPVTD